MPRERLSSRSLSARVFWLIAGIILLVAFVAVMPGLSLDRQNWLRDRVIQAHLAAMSIKDGAGPADPALRDTLLRLSDSVAISLKSGNTEISLLPDTMPAQSAAIDLDQESPITRLWRADLDLLGLAPPFARIAVTYPGSAARLEVTISRRELTRDLRRSMARSAEIAVVLAAVTASLVFAALDRLLVRPMRIITASIAGFRRSPGHSGLGGLKWLSARGDDEIALAARELAAMQDELRAVLWRNARLAALGTAVNTINHDLRNILASALMTAGRLQHHEDPKVQRAANILVTAIERAVDLVSRTKDFAQEGPPAVTRSAVGLHELVNEVADMLLAADASVTFENRVPPGLVLPLDRSQIYRVLVNLLRNAMEAGASLISLQAERIGGIDALTVADNGPGLPPKIVSNLFQPFIAAGRNGSTGLGLAIAHDLIRAHGGDLTLRKTGPEGTIFVLALSGPATPEPAEVPAAASNDAASFHGQFATQK